MLDLYQLALAALASSALGCVLLGSRFANIPLKAAGSNSGSGYNTCCVGYDSARGEFSLLATAIIFAPFLLPLAVLPPSTIIYVLAAIALIVLWQFGLRSGVSHPGGPRAHRILRQPQWADKAWPAPTGWRCEVSEASHDVTHRQLPNGQTLTGEPADISAPKLSGSLLF